jgi:hypothetical protein
MAVKICGDRTTLGPGGTIIAKAERRLGGWWEVTNWPNFFDRDQAITVLTVTELLEQGYLGSDVKIFPSWCSPSRAAMDRSRSLVALVLALSTVTMARTARVSSGPRRRPGTG